tara:strand:- start:1266 stop:1478 length:213 start_codon:yes stop_codon:yes gene_type:complete
LNEAGNAHEWCCGHYGDKRINGAEHTMSFRGRSRRIWSLNTAFCLTNAKRFYLFGSLSNVRNFENIVLGQ